MAALWQPPKVLAFVPSRTMSWEIPAPKTQHASALWKSGVYHPPETDLSAVLHLRRSSGV